MPLADQAAIRIRGPLIPRQSRRQGLPYTFGTAIWLAVVPVMWFFPRTCRSFPAPAFFRSCRCALSDPPAVWTECFFVDQQSVSRTEVRCQLVSWYGAMFAKVSHPFYPNFEGLERLMLIMIPAHPSSLRSSSTISRGNHHCWWIAVAQQRFTMLNRDG